MTERVDEDLLRTTLAAVAAQHDQGAGAAAQDAFDAVAQLGARGDGGEHCSQLLVDLGHGVPPGLA